VTRSLTCEGITPGHGRSSESFAKPLRHHRITSGIAQPRIIRAIAVDLKRLCRLATPLGTGAQDRHVMCGRFVLTVDDLETRVEGLGEQGVEFRNDIVENQGRNQILCSDPLGSIVEPFQAP
jgi:hypothetical protein